MVGRPPRGLVPVAKDVTYRAGASNGTDVQGEERPTPTDIGLSSSRTSAPSFIGQKQWPEWAW